MPESVRLTKEEMDQAYDHRMVLAILGRRGITIIAVAAAKSKSNWLPTSCSGSRQPQSPAKR